MRQDGTAIHPMLLHSRRTTAQSRPFRTGYAIDRELGARLDESGYIEDEFVVRGTADTFTYDSEWKRVPDERGLEYTVRVLVRRPRHAADSTGVYVAEALHPGADRDLVWRANHPWLTRSGHSWVGVTISSRWTQLMKNELDPERYQDLDLPDDGLQWSIMAQVLTMLRAGELSGPDPVPIARLYMSGWSMTGTFCRVFLRDGFHEEARTPSGGPAVDGYLIAISSGGFIEGGYTPLSSGCPRLPADDARRTIRDHGVPVIEMLSENEAETHEQVTRPDCDLDEEGLGPYRLFEIAGSGHASHRVRRGWPSDDAAAPHSSPEPVLVEQLSDFPFEYLSRAVFEMLERWVADGVNPPRCPRLFRAEDGLKGPAKESRPLLRDDDSNALGGVRTVHVDVPSAGYVPHSTRVHEGEGAHGGWLHPHMEPFSPLKMRSRYGSARGFVDRVVGRSQELVGAGWLLPEEAELIVAEAKMKADKMMEEE